MTLWDALIFTAFGYIAHAVIAWRKRHQELREKNALLENNARLHRAVAHLQEQLETHVAAGNVRTRSDALGLVRKVGNGNLTSN